METRSDSKSTSAVKHRLYKWHLKRARDLATKGMEKAKILSAIFTIFTGTDFRNLKLPEGKPCARKVKHGGMIMWLGNTWTNQACTSPDRMHTQELWEFVSFTARPLLILSKRLWKLGKAPEDCMPENWKNTNVTFVFKKRKKETLRNCRLVSFSPLFLGNKMEQIILQIISKGQTAWLRKLSKLSPVKTWNWPWASYLFFVAKEDSGLLSCIRSSNMSRLRKVILPYSSAGETHLGPVFSSRLHNAREMR